MRASRRAVHRAISILAKVSTPTLLVRADGPTLPTQPMLK
jgi:hypothetical protein